MFLEQGAYADERRAKHSHSQKMEPGPRIIFSVGPNNRWMIQWKAILR
jgi:hypothetical protein